MPNIAKALMKKYNGDAALMKEQAESKCNEHSPFWAIETDVYYFNDGSLLWFDSYGEYGDTHLWAVFDTNNGIISPAYECYDSAVETLLGYVKDNPENAKGFYGIVDLFGNEDLYNG